MSEVALAFLTSPVVILVLALVVAMYTNCPSCKGRVKRDATVCRHCGVPLTKGRKRRGQSGSQSMGQTWVAPDPAQRQAPPTRTASQPATVQVAAPGFLPDPPAGSSSAGGTGRTGATTWLPATASGSTRRLPPAAGASGDARGSTQSVSPPSRITVAP